MSDQQGNEALIPEVVAGGGEAGHVLPGALLAAQRQARGWSVEHAASQLKFAPRQVLALESDNYDALPGPVIVRGFVRAYAKLLGMDANALVAALPNQGALPGERIVPQRTLSTPFSESPLPLGNRKKPVPGWLIGGAVALVVVAAAGAVLHETDLLDRLPQMAWLKQGGKPAAVPDEQAVQTPAEQADLPPEVQDGTDRTKQEKADVVSDAAVATASPVAATETVAAAVPVVSPAPVTAAATPVAATPAVSAAVVPPAAATKEAASSVPANLNISKSKDLLRLNFREDSWVEIRRGDNSIIISRLLKGGTAESFDISEPVTLVVGNVAGVDASLRGVKLDLQTGNNNNVARVNLK